MLPIAFYQGGPGSDQKDDVWIRAFFVRGHSSPHQYGAWDTKVDRFLDDSGIGDMISLLMYVNGQKDGGEPTVPVSWRKNPNFAKKFLGDALDLEQVEAPLLAKAGLIEAYDLLRSEHVKARHAARKERNLSKSDEVALGLEVTVRDAKTDTAELSRIAKNTDWKNFWTT